MEIDKRRPGLAHFLKKDLLLPTPLSLNFVLPAAQSKKYLQEIDSAFVTRYYKQRAQFEGRSSR